MRNETLEFPGTPSSLREEGFYD
ncbi:hypothetical protein VTH06DRAFT_7523 [Thermothelomyces fergusii]